jgi:glucose dehydrogenase
MPRWAQTGSELPLALSTPAFWLALGPVLAVPFITDLRTPPGALDSIPCVLAVVLTTCAAAAARNQSSRRVVTAIEEPGINA